MKKCILQISDTNCLSVCFDLHVNFAFVLKINLYFNIAVFFFSQFANKLPTCMALYVFKMQRLCAC